MAQESISSRQICFLWSAANTDTDNDFMQGRKYNRVKSSYQRWNLPLARYTPQSTANVWNNSDSGRSFPSCIHCKLAIYFFCPLCNFVYSHPCPLDTEQCGFRYSVLEFHAHSEYHFAVHIFRKTFVFQVENIVRVMRKWAKDNRVPVWKNANNVFVGIKLFYQIDFGEKSKW